MNQVQVTAIFNLAGLEALSLTQIRNDYWPDHENYDEIRNANPWWEVKTSEGMIRIGWRKRVIEIDWSATHRRGLVTEDDVTKKDYMVHAWDVGQAISYLSRLRSLPLVDMVNVHDKTYVIHGKKDVASVLELVMSDNLSAGHKTIIENILHQVADDGWLRMRVVKNKDYTTVKIKTPTVYLEINP